MTTVDSWASIPQVESTISNSSPLPPRGGRYVSGHQNSISEITREPVAIHGSVDHRSTLTPRTNERSPLASNSATNNISESAMAGHSRRGRNAAEPPQHPMRRSNSDRRLQQPDSPSVQSQMSGPAQDWQWEQNNDPDDQEQALFEQRLCDDIYGVAVRKINQNGKSNLRYVKCCLVDSSELDVDAIGYSSSRSLSSRSRMSFSRLSRDRRLDRRESREYEAQRTSIQGKKVRVLTWGKKKDIKIPLERFLCVRKGKTTDRSRRNVCPPSRNLSLITDDPFNASLDIEAPTRLDRDKFARAFARFLRIPLEGDDIRSVRTDMTPSSFNGELNY